MSTHQDQDKWLARNTFYCKRLRCRMTPEYCRFLQGLYAEGEKIPFQEWMDACSGRKKQLANIRRPLGCDYCPKGKKLSSKGDLNMNQNEKDDELRFKKRVVELSNQDIVEFAYQTKDIIEHVLGKKLFFEEANCYTACFYKIRRLLKSVDTEYLDLGQHKNLAEFYREGRELSNNWDRLRWVNPEQSDDSDCLSHQEDSLTRGE